MRLFLLRLLAGGTLLGAVSCEKVIDLKPADTVPKVVVEAEISDSLEPWTVQLSKSVPLGSSNQASPLRGSSVWITDATAGTTDTLGEARPGQYFTPPKAGVPGHRYNITVATPGNGIFTATSTMPQKVPFDSVYIEVTSFLGQTGGQIFPRYKDPPGVPNYYQFRALIGGRVAARDARNDQFTDGIVSGQPLLLPINDSLKTGDSLVVEMQCVDGAIFKYFLLLFQSTGGAGGTVAAPGNPVGNIAGGALGYFNAHTVSRRVLVLP